MHQKKQPKNRPNLTGNTELSGGTNDWRIRVGDYRVIYKVDDEAQTILITVIRHRKDVYDHI